jgi:hypothetical protein
VLSLAQRGQVQAAEERGQLRPRPGDLVQDRLDLRRAGDRPAVSGYRGPGCFPPDAVEGVGGQQPEFDGVARGAVEYGSFAGDGGDRGALAVEPRCEGVQGMAGYPRVGQAGQRQ